MPRTRETRLAYSTGGEADEEPVSGASAPAGGGPGIRLRLDRRASSRVVTVVTGLPLPEGPALARALRAACGAGGTFKEGILELQGDHRDRVEAELCARGLRSKRSGG
jgi:translation initiation factor 1